MKIIYEKNDKVRDKKTGQVFTVMHNMLAGDAMAMASGNARQGLSVIDASGEVVDMRMGDDVEPAEFGDVSTTIYTDQEKAEREALKAVYVDHIDDIREVGGIIKELLDYVPTARLRSITSLTEIGDDEVDEEDDDGDEDTGSEG